MPKKLCELQLLTHLCPHSLLGYVGLQDARISLLGIAIIQDFYRQREGEGEVAESETSCHVYLYDTPHVKLHVKLHVHVAHKCRGVDVHALANSSRKPQPYTHTCGTSQKVNKHRHMH